MIAKQKISVSTPQILRQINYEKLHHLNNEALLANLKEEDWQEATKYMGNVLEPLTMKFYPEIGRLKNKKRIQNSIRGFCRDVHVVTLL